MVLTRAFVFGCTAAALLSFTPAQAEAGSSTSRTRATRRSSKSVHRKKASGANWIENRIEPGDSVELDFETAEGQCSVRTRSALSTALTSMPMSITARPTCSRFIPTLWSGRLPSKAANRS